jgi:hypothetical protein
LLLATFHNISNILSSNYQIFYLNEIRRLRKHKTI